MNNRANQIILFFILNLISPTSAQADQNCTPWDNEHIPADELIIGQITVKAQNIFDHNIREENHHIHRLANLLHIQTREQTIASQLLFKSGDLFDLRLLQETERNIRANAYINNARIRPVKICGNRVDILVQTTDNWTLTPNISYGQSGGVTTSGVSITEENLFGTGKIFSIGYSHGVDRNESSFRYTDPQLNDTRQIFSLSAQDNSDGEAYGLDLELPFYQLNSRKAWGTSISANKKIAPLYQGGTISSEIGESTKSASLYYGWSDGLFNHHINRTRIGWLYNATDYRSINGSRPLINSNELSYPWIEYEDFKEQYIQKYNFRSMGKIEDISLGSHITTRLGLATKGLGSSDDYLYFSTHYSQGFHASQNQLGLLSFELETFAGDGFLNGNDINIEGEWFWFQDYGSNYYLSAKYNMIDNLLPGEQVVLGGETGLRGYPIRYQTGDKSFMLSAEKHHFFKWYPYNLFKFGALIFVDAGSAWGRGNARNIIADAGVGLRFVSTRSTGSSVLHIDLAIPYNAPDNIDSYQLSIKAQKFL